MLSIGHTPSSLEVPSTLVHGLLALPPSDLPHQRSICNGQVSVF